MGVVINMSDFFITQWTGFEVGLVIMVIFCGIILLLTVPLTLERWELEDLQRDSIPNMECEKLGEFILGDEITYNVKELADRHFYVRCK